MRKLLRFFSPSVLRSVLHHDPVIEGKFRLELRDGGKLRTVREGKNIWTLTGREYLAELIALQDSSPRTVFRQDRIAYVGLGTGAQAEVSNIGSLVEPVPYRSAEFLAELQTPSAFTSTSSGTERTAVQFVREFGKSEISLGYNVVITEAGLFTDGDPDDDWDTSSTPTDYATAASRAPMAYKTIEPVTKTTQFTLRLIWEVRFV